MEVTFELDIDEVVERVQNDLDIEDMVRDAIDITALAEEVTDNLDFDTSDVASAQDLVNIEQRLSDAEASIDTRNSDSLEARFGAIEEALAASEKRVKRLEQVLVGIGAGLSLLDGQP